MMVPHRDLLRPDMRVLTGRQAVTGGETKTAVGFADSIWRYVRILGGVLAAIGFCLVFGLQSGWVGIVWSPSPALMEVFAKDGGIGGAVIRATGPKTLFSKEMIAVDTGKTYRLDADVRVLPQAGSPRTSVVYLGVSTYDADGKELKSPPGSYRYAGAVGRNVRSDQGWVHLGGTITGEGDENHHQFRPGTHSIKLVLLANYRSKDAPVLLIRDVTFSEFVAIGP
jgi:hypothetical protein